jgi:hypothetical protein
MIYFRTKLVEKFLPKLPQSGKPEQIRVKYEITAALKSESIWVSIRKVLAMYNGVGYVVTQLAEAPRYKPEGRGFDSPWYQSNFSLT